LLYHFLTAARLGALTTLFGVLGGVSDPLRQDPLEILVRGSRVVGDRVYSAGCFAE